jgi:hypothetical protein
MDETQPRYSLKLAQTDGYRWASCRTAYNLREALVYLILGGDSDAFLEVTQANLPLFMDRLSLTAASYHTSQTPGIQFFTLFFKTLTQTQWHRVRSASFQLLRESGGL